MVEFESIGVDFWLCLREKTCVQWKVGAGLCARWCEEVLPMLGKNSGFVQKHVEWEDHWDQYCTLNLYHNWLQKEEGKRIFIADGTAGQFSKDYPNGYYGYLDDAPEKLKQVYFRQFNQVNR